MIFSGIFLTLFEGKIAAPLFEISPLYVLSKLSSSSISKSSNSAGSVCAFLNLFIAESSNVFMEILPSAISLKEITVFLSLSSGTNDFSPAVSWEVLSFASNTKSSWLSIFYKQSSTVIRAIRIALINEKKD